MNALNNGNKIVKFTVLIVILLIFSCSSNLPVSKLPLLLDEKFENGAAERWLPNSLDDWRVVKQNGEFVYELTRPGNHGEIRKPTAFSILDDVVVGDFELEVIGKCYTETANLNRDLCLIFGYQDSLHFYYAHFSAKSDNVHNIIGVVNGADRVKINHELAGSSAALLKDEQWYKLRVKRDAASGKIECFVNDIPSPVFTATDTTFRFGKVGVGSFDDTGAFRAIKLWGERKHF